MIKIICVGKIKEEYLTNLINDYYKRISKYHKIEIIELKDSTKETEAQSILKVLDPKDYIISLDIKGNQMTSTAFAQFIDKTFNHHSIITFIIGGSNGLTDQIKNMSNYSLSFSSLTFPHGLFRGILLEQIYRAFKINNNETYHK